jgi:hypothetical protein
MQTILLQSRFAAVQRLQTRMDGLIVNENDLLNI